MKALVYLSGNTEQRWLKLPTMLSEDARMPNRDLRLFYRQGRPLYPQK